MWKMLFCTRSSSLTGCARQSVTLGAAAGRMHVHRGMRQGKALALGARGQKDRGHAGSDANRPRRHRRRDHVHRIINGQTGVDAAAGRVDVQLDVTLGVFVVEEEKLGDDQVCDLVIDGKAQEDDALLQQERVDVHGALAAAGPNKLSAVVAHDLSGLIGDRGGGR